MKKYSRISGQLLQCDYDRVMALSEDECCFSLTKREVAMILSMTDYFSWKTRWYSDLDTPVDQQTITTLREGLEYKLMSGCCPDDDKLTRYDDDGDFQVSDDGGVTWEDAPNEDPRNKAPQSPPLPGTASPEKRCAAADNIRDIFTQYRDNLNDLLTASPTLVAIVAGILAAIAVVTGVSGVAVGLSVLIMGLAAGLLSLSEGEILEQIDDTVLEQFKCLVFCRMDEDGRLTYAAWKGLLSDIATTYSDFPELFFYQTVNAMGYIGVNNAGTVGVATAEDCTDCDCVCPSRPALTGNPGKGIVTYLGGNNYQIESQLYYNPDAGMNMQGAQIKGVVGEMCFTVTEWDTTSTGEIRTFVTECDGTYIGINSPTAHCCFNVDFAPPAADPTTPYTVTLHVCGC